MIGRVFLGQYETLHRLGEGGMGSVYLARPRDQGDPVVVKVMHGHIVADPTFRERFERETLLMSRLKHPNTVAFIDASMDDPEGPCIVMEYLAGVTLDKLMTKNGRFSPMRLRRLLAQFCDVLQAAHDAGIIHRDLKPANLMVLDPDTPFEKLKVMDFGLAEMASQNGPRKAEYAVGTAGYMPPEQVRGEKMDARGDLYSVGVILYQMLSGRLPFAGTSAMEIILDQATEGPPTFASLGLGDKVPPAVEAVVRACLSEDPGDRPASARALVDAYEAALERAYAPPEEQSTSGQPPPAAAAAAADAPTDVIVEHMEAWLPESIAAFKLRGFVEEVGGKVVESRSGLIRVRLPGPTVGVASRMFGLLKGSRPSTPIDMELHMKKKDPSQPNLLSVTVMFRPLGGGKLPTHPAWGARCGKVLQVLRGYLMSQN